MFRNSLNAQFIDKGFLFQNERRAQGFLESKVVRWSDFERLSNDEMVEIMDEEGFRFNEF